QKLVPDMPAGLSPPRSTVTGAAGWLRSMSRYSALSRRLESLVGLVGLSEGTRELAKPSYELVWPKDVDEFDPDLGNPNLPVNLTTIQRDLDRMRADLAEVGGELAVSSFIWMVKDGMIVDPIRNRNLWEFLNLQYYPFRYKDIERLAAFQNRVLAKYAAVHGLTFLKVAENMPLDPDLFADALHDNFHGMRMQAWVMLQQIVPLTERRLASGVWPKPAAAMGKHHPAFEAKPREMTIDCHGPMRTSGSQ